MPEHDKVGDQAHPEVDEGGRLVLLKKEMANPGKAVPAHRNEGDQPEWSDEQPIDQQSDQSSRADKMERSAGRVLVFSKVIGIEFLEGGVLFIHRNQLGYQCTIRNKMDLDT